MNIKVGYCVAYDWELLKKSIPRVYDYADVICLSIDKNRRSWGGERYAFDEEAFLKWTKEIDVQSKLLIYEDDFFLPELQSIENDNRQRNLMAQFLGEGGWHIQIDSDEYFLNFKGFVEYLISLNKAPTSNEKPINVCCNWISLIKQTEEGYVFVDNPIDLLETMPFATNKPLYENARRNGYFNHISPFYVLHETWARGEEQLREKLNNWGHNSDFHDKESYFKLWKAIDENNCKYLKNLHPLQCEIWQKLDYIKAKSVEDLIQIINSQKKQLSSFDFLLVNSRNWQRTKALLKGIFS